MGYPEYESQSAPFGIPGTRGALTIVCMCVIQLKSSGLPISLVHISRTTPPSKSRCYCVAPVMLLRLSFRHRYGVRQCPLFAPWSSPSIMCFRPYPLHIAVARVQSSAMPGWNRNENVCHGIQFDSLLRTGYVHSHTHLL